MTAPSLRWPEDSRVGWKSSDAPALERTEDIDVRGLQRLAGPASQSCRRYRGYLVCSSSYIRTTARGSGRAAFGPKCCTWALRSTRRAALWAETPWA